MKQLNLADLVIIGGGPAGLSAALNARLEGFSTVVIERAEVGGRAAQSARIDNLLGGSLSGPEFASKARQHCLERGVRFVSNEIISILPREGLHEVVTLEGRENWLAKAVIIATGLRWRELEEIVGVNEAIASGLAKYGCQAEEAANVKGLKVGVLGGANSAGINALHFAEQGAEVQMFLRSDLRLSDYLRKQIGANPHIYVGRNNPITKLKTVMVPRPGTQEMNGVGLWVDRLNSSYPVWVDKLFLFPDAYPNPPVLPRETAKLDGFLVTDDFGMTNVPGIFAAGDVVAGTRKRIATAVGEGAAVIFGVKNFLDSKRAQVCQSCLV